MTNLPQDVILDVIDPATRERRTFLCAARPLCLTSSFFREHPLLQGIHASTNRKSTTGTTNTISSSNRKQQNANAPRLNIQCDLATFAWLIAWINASNEIDRPDLNEINVTSLLISSHFLGMRRITNAAVQYIATHLSDVICQPIDFNCVPPDLIRRIARQTDKRYLIKMISTNQCHNNALVEALAEFHNVDMMLSAYSVQTSDAHSDEFQSNFQTSRGLSDLTAPSHTSTKQPDLSVTSSTSTKQRASDAQVRDSNKMDTSSSRKTNVQSTSSTIKPGDINSTFPAHSPRVNSRRTMISSKNSTADSGHSTRQQASRHDVRKATSGSKTQKESQSQPPTESDDKFNHMQNMERSYRNNASLPFSRRSILGVGRIVRADNLKHLEEVATDNEHARILRDARRDEDMFYRSSALLRLVSSCDLFPPPERN